MLYLLHSWRIYHFVLIEYSLYGYLNSSLGKNLSQYSPIGTWLTVALIVLIQSKFECLKNLSYRPPLAINSSIGLKSSLMSSRKCLFLLSKAWKSIFQLFKVLLHLFFLLKSQDNLHEKIRARSNCFVSLSMTVWRP